MTEHAPTNSIDLWQAVGHVIESLQNQVNDLIERAEAADNAANESQRFIWGRLTAHEQRIVKLSSNVGRTDRVHPEKERDDPDSMDDLYLRLHSARELLWMAHMSVASTEIKGHIEDAVTAINGAGSAMSTQWSAR